MTMGGTTPNGLPFPTGEDRVMDGDNAIEALARAIDTKALLSGDSGDVSPATAGFVVVAPFTALSGWMRRRNGIVQVSMAVNAGSAITAGNITNINMVSIPVGWRPKDRASMSTTSAGPVVAVYANSQGFIVLSATASAVSAGSPITCSGMWFV
jgi:hypothetical protein